MNRIGSALCLSTLLATWVLRAQTEVALRLRSDSKGWMITWPAALRDSKGAEQFPSFELQTSADLQSWTSVGPPLRGSTDEPSASLSARLTAHSPKAFYRVQARVTSTARPMQLAQGGAEVFGYAARFTNELARIGQITPQEFATRYPAPASYLPALDWDPTTADFWTEFNTDPELYNLS